jgi:hypothetical protein
VVAKDLERKWKVKLVVAVELKGARSDVCPRNAPQSGTLTRLIFLAAQSISLLQNLVSMLEAKGGWRLG